MTNIANFAKVKCQVYVVKEERLVVRNMRKELRENNLKIRGFSSCLFFATAFLRANQWKIAKIKKISPGCAKLNLEAVFFVFYSHPRLHRSFHRFQSRCVFLGSSSVVNLQPLIKFLKVSALIILFRRLTRLASSQQYNKSFLKNFCSGDFDIKETLNGKRPSFINQAPGASLVCNSLEVSFFGEVFTTCYTR